MGQQGGVSRFSTPLLVSRGTSQFAGQTRGGGFGLKAIMTLGVSEGGCFAENIEHEVFIELLDEIVRELEDDCCQSTFFLRGKINGSSSSSCLHIQTKSE